MIKHTTFLAVVALCLSCSNSQNNTQNQEPVEEATIETLQECQSIGETSEAKINGTPIDEYLVNENIADASKQYLNNEIQLTELSLEFMEGLNSEDAMIRSYYLFVASKLLSESESVAELGDYLHNYVQNYPQEFVCNMQQAYYQETTTKFITILSDNMEDERSKQVFELALFRNCSKCPESTIEILYGYLKQMRESKTAEAL